MFIFPQVWKWNFDLVFRSNDVFINLTYVQQFLFAFCKVYRISFQIVIIFSWRDFWKLNSIVSIIAQEISVWFLRDYVAQSIWNHVKVIIACWDFFENVLEHILRQRLRHCSFVVHCFFLSFVKHIFEHSKPVTINYFVLNI